MASKTLASTTLLLSLNLLFFTLVSSQQNPPSPTRPAPSPLAPSPLGRCPDLRVCVQLADTLLGVVIGQPPTRECCSLIEGLVDLEAAICVCAAIRVHVLEVLNIDLHIALRAVLNYCHRTPPAGFQCPRA